MALTVIASGTVTGSSIGAETTVVTDTANHEYVLKLDMNALANGDIVEVRIKSAFEAGPLYREEAGVVYQGAQAQPNKQSPRILADLGLQATIKQTAGTLRAIPWKLYATT